MLFYFFKIKNDYTFFRRKVAERENEVFKVLKFILKSAWQPNWSYFCLESFGCSFNVRKLNSEVNSEPNNSSLTVV